ncbi:AAA family ATPase [Mesorhizobium sp. M0437]|uniref:ATP-binding protein n=1 Tax=Mesorhizobium sp. M0437 TaxID=2956945 RepID=UPI003338A25D
MIEFTPQLLHLHTLESLLTDLVSDRAVAIDGDVLFALADNRARSALQWYRTRGAANWIANVSAAHAEQLVDAILAEPPEVAAIPARAANTNNRRLTLVKLEAHRFAGLHKFGTPGAPPQNYVHEFTAPVTLFEGRNGSGKTSLANAIIWGLTGEILRPQREPERADVDFDCWIANADGEDGETAHRLSPVTPMPDVSQFRPDQGWVPADTWVELTFADEEGEILPPVRRIQRRTARGVLEEIPPELAGLAIDPIAVRIGTVMPGLLPLIKVGSESELGRAVAELTGLSALVDLAGHALRAKNKIKEFIKAKTKELEGIDRIYRTARDDFTAELKPYPALVPPKAMPEPSSDATAEETLDEITGYFEATKATAYESVRDILGEGFDPVDPKRSADLETSIAPALNEVGQPQRLPSMARLRGFRELSSEQLSTAETKIAEIVREAKLLDALARDPSSAARSRLYAHVATWIEEHPDAVRTEDQCVVCGGSLVEAQDPVSGRLVKTHIHEASLDASLIAQTLNRWSQIALGELNSVLPEALQAELKRDLPTHPIDLIRKALVDELFALDAFGGELVALKSETAKAFDEVVKQSPDLPAATPISLPATCAALTEGLKRLDLALRFARWRQENEVFARQVFENVVGRRRKTGELPEKVTLMGKLLELDVTVKGAEPITKALAKCTRLKDEIKLRRAAEKRIAEYETAGTALVNLSKLGELADRQVDQLRKTLRTEAALWRSRIYVSTFPSTAHELVDASMGRKGKLDLVVRAGGVSAPAQHVTNASALRASLVGFFFAFWEHVLKTRGGLKTLLLDDPQELLDDENRQQLANSFGTLIELGAQLIVTSYDRRFAGVVARLPVRPAVEHLAVHPATLNQPVVRTTPHQAEIEARKELYDRDRNAEEPARSYADGCRVFFEAALGDVFDDPAHLVWAKANPDPTLRTFADRLRSCIKAGPQGMFAMQVFSDFISHPALAEGSLVLQLMNKAHHGNRQEIRPGEVAQCADDLGQLVVLTGRMYEECDRWKRRAAISPTPTGAVDVPPALDPMTPPSLNLIVYPDLAAFTQHSPAMGSQEATEPFDPKLLVGKAVFYLRRHNFGFAAPQGSLAIVEAQPGPVLDRRLVIARHGQSIFARRFLRSKGSDFIGLTAEVPDPSAKSPYTVFFPEAEVSVHQVAGVLFDHDIKVDQGQDEAVLVDASKVLARVEVGFRVVDESAVPLALPKQIVLGGPSISLAEIGHHEGTLVALALDSGAGIFKRIGSALPGNLAHLRQFESIGGLGSSEVLSVGKAQPGVPQVQHVRRIIGVIYNG